MLEDLKMRSRRFEFVGVLAAVPFALSCVDGQRARGDQDTNGKDITVADVDTLVSDGDTGGLPDTDATVSLDADPEDTVSTDADTGDLDTTGSCQGPQDCTPPSPSPCILYQCIDFRCVETPLEDDVHCSDGNACTVDDECHDGVCRPGDALDCDAFHRDCWQAKSNTCNPASGCDGMAEPANTICDDGVGPDPGTCGKGWRIPHDRCDGAGFCVDRSPDIPTAIHPLAGNWFVVLASAPEGGGGATLRGQLSFDTTGGVTFTRGVSTIVSLGEAFTSSSGGYCTALSGETAISIGGHTFRAFADKNAELMTLYSNDDEPLHGLAIRATGTPAQITGTYRLVSTAHYASGAGDAVMTWQGHLGFTVGCITDGGSVSTSPDLDAPHSYGLTTPSCFGAHDGGHRIPITVLSSADTSGTLQTTQAQWTGALGPRGEVLLLTRDDGALHYGILVLVRDRLIDRAKLSGPYAFVSMYGGIASPTQTISTLTPQLDAGIIDYQAGATVDGRLFGRGDADDGTDEVRVVGPGWWHTPPAGARYSHRAVFGTHVFEHTGWVSPNDRFVMGWRANPPSQQAHIPQVLDMTPLEGSLFLAVQPTTYGMGSGLPD